MRQIFRLVVCLAVATTAAAAPPRVLITGATGRTGAPLYFQLKAREDIGEVRALVRSVEKARKVLNCSACDASEGIFVGDVTNVTSMVPAAAGMDTVAIAAGVSGFGPGNASRAVEFDGVENTVAAFALPNANSADLRVVLCSSMGTTQPSPKPMEGGDILFWKLNAEAFLGASGIGTTVVKPCGLIDGPRGSNALLVGHDDTLLSTRPPTVSRADVAAVMAEAIVERASGLRFDLCSKAGPPTKDLKGLLATARYAWARAA